MPYGRFLEVPRASIENSNDEFPKIPKNKGKTEDEEEGEEEEENLKKNLSNRSSVSSCRAEAGSEGAPRVP